MVTPVELVARPAFAVKPSVPAPVGAPRRTEFASARKKKQKETANSQWHHNTPLLTEKRFQAANRSWTKRQLQAVVIFFRRSIRSKPKL
jgi:hypothetical protein